MGSALIGIFVLAGYITAIGAGGEPPGLAQILQAPFVLFFWSYRVAALPAAAAGVYVAIRVGLTSRMGWAETVILSLVCLLVIPGAAEEVLHFDLQNWGAAFILVSCSLFAALTLRYLAGRRGLVR